MANTGDPSHGGIDFAPFSSTTIGGWLLDVIGFVGLALGGAQAAAISRLDELSQDAWAATPHRRLTPPTLAEMVVKNVITLDQGAAEAAFSGMRRDRFEDLVRATGNPPGSGELLTLWRRRKISDDEIHTGLRQGYLKDEWSSFIMDLRHDPLALGEAVQAAVQNHLSYDAAAEYADMNGVARDVFDIMFANAGNPPGPGEVLDLWNRGDLTEAEVDQALRESRLKDKWIEPLKRRAIHKIPMRTITTLITHGAIDDPTAIQHLRELGYVQTDAEAIVSAAHFAKAAPLKTLTVTAIKQLFVDHLITREQAIADLATLSYPEAVSAQILDLAAHEIAIRDRRATISKIRAAYLRRDITRVEASGDLDKIGTDGAQRDALLGLWDIELDVNRVGLTPAQVVHAGKLELFEPEEVLARLIADGYSEMDAVILGMIGGAIPLPPKQPTTGA